MTNIIPIAPEMGQCFVCDGLNRKLQFRDQTTGRKVGMCCVEFLRRADAFLCYCVAMDPKLSHPTPAVP